MRRSSLAVAILMVCSLAGMSAQTTQAKKYGTALTLTEVTRVSDIYANPAKFNGKRVQVQGPIVDVCAEKGCWLAIGSDKEFQTIRFKVDDGVIVFPMTLKGLNAKVEGTITVTLQSVEDQIKQGQEMAREKKTTFDPATIKGPKTSIQIKGEGAVVY